MISAPVEAFLVCMETIKAKQQLEASQMTLELNFGEKKYISITSQM